MGKFVLKDAFVEINDVDLSDNCSSVTIETTFDDVDVTAFGSTYREILQGLGDATVTLTMFQDFDSSSVDDTLWPLSQSGDTFSVKIRHSSEPVAADNPEYSMTGVLLEYSPIAGSIGEASTTDVTIRNASQDGLERSTGAS